MLVKLRTWWCAASNYERVVTICVPVLGMWFAFYTWMSNPSEDASNQMLGRMREEMMQLVSDDDPVRSREGGADYGGAYVIWTVKSTADFDEKFANISLLLKSFGWKRSSEAMTWCKGEMLLGLAERRSETQQQSYYLYEMTYDVSTIRRCSNI